MLADIAEIFESWEGGDRRVCCDFDGTSMVAPKATGFACVAAIAATVGMWVERESVLFGWVEGLYVVNCRCKCR
jgi:hypothetical protein